MCVHTIRPNSPRTEYVVTRRRRGGDDDAATCTHQEVQCFDACVESLRRMRRISGQRTCPMSHTDHRTCPTDSFPADMFLSMLRNLSAGSLSVGHVRWLVRLIGHVRWACVEALNFLGRACRRVIVAATSPPRHCVFCPRGI